jgi:hypothetical protein
LLLGAAGVFGQLQHALNRVWEVEPDPAQGGVKNSSSNACCPWAWCWPSASCCSFRSC